MTDAAELVAALYAKLGTWQAVADACNGKALRHSAGYYQQVAVGRIAKPSKATRAGMVSATESQESLLKRAEMRVPRGGIVVQRSLWLRLQAVRLRESWTWDELLERALELLEEGGEG